MTGLCSLRVENIIVNMYHAGAQGVDDRMINVHYYYYDGLTDDDTYDDRFDEGLQDITAASIQMVGEPREVFTNLLKGHGTTR